ncbi:hypothetical protein [Arthrobacter sp. H20]|uniref:hypothetical protein n=1 Tax=Arthrobacter sp. H20 TaxID=1267981 RepID=UPI0004B177EA|nr:hypothetical protein [Arthrobacter sp. H20]
MQAFKMGAASMTFSYRTAPMGFDWPDTVSERPLLTRFDGSTGHFSDGTSAEFDAVILCTGYQHKFPFLPTELALHTPNVLYPDNLYKGVLWQDNPHLMYLGMQDQYFTFNMFDAQAWFARDVMMGTIPLPSAAERTDDANRWLDRQLTITSHFDDVDFQANYLRDLIMATDYPPFDLDRVADLFKQWLINKENNILGYRDDTHTSVMTGTEASVHHTPWLSAMDDSLERFLGSTTTAPESALTHPTGSSTPGR